MANDPKTWKGITPSTIIVDELSEMSLPDMQALLYAGLQNEMRGLVKDAMQEDLEVESKTEKPLFNASQRADNRRRNRFARKSRRANRGN